MSDDNQYTKRDYRYERKFVVASDRLDQLLLRIKLHRVGFFEPFPPRYVNNVYFDSVDHASAWDNINGVSSRTKLRVRWYGDLEACASPFLEYKIKQGLVGTKQRYELSKVERADDLSLATRVERAVRSATLPNAVKLELSFLRPSLVNRYHRRYFETADRSFRLTVDTDLSFMAPSQAGAMKRLLSQAIVELKYDRGQDGLAESVIDGFGLRLEKSSKYVTGLDVVG